MNSKFEDHQTYSYFALQCYYFFCIAMFLQCSCFLLHLRLPKLILGFLGLRGKWFGWSRGGLSVSSKFGGHEYTFIFALHVFVALQIFVHLRLLKLILRFLGLRGEWLGWFKGGGLECELKCWRP